MNVFEHMGAAHFLMMEGQRQIAAKFGNSFRRTLARVLGMLGRNLPDGNHAPW